MSDNEQAAKPLTEQEQEQQILARSGQIQLCLLQVLNDPALGCIEMPHITAHAVAELLGQVLRAVVLRNPNHAPWTMDIIEHVRGFVLDATITPHTDPGATKH